MGGPNVNFKTLRLLKEEKEQDIESPKLLDIGSCGLHTVHCAFKAGMKPTSWDIVEFLRALCKIFKDVPARRGKFIEITKSEPLKFCPIRWIENVRMAERTLAMLPSLKKYIEVVEESNSKPSYKSYNMWFKVTEPIVEFKNIRSTLYRRKSSAMPPTPSNLQEYASILKEYVHYSTTLDKPPQPFYQNFIQDKKSRNWSAVIFSSPVLVEMLSQSKHVVLDTSFKALPKELKACELLTIYGSYMKHLFPAVFVVISRGTEASYRSVLNKILTSICPESKLVAEVVVTDHEKSIRNAAVSAWPKATHIGSAFHYAQAIYQMHSRLHLNSLTEHNSCAGKALRMLMVWALLPSSLLKLGLDEIKHFIKINELEHYFEGLLEYMTDYWLNTIGPKKTSLSNCNHMISLETEHFFYQIIDLMGPLPSVWEFTSQLRSLENNVSIDIKKLRIGKLIGRPKRARTLKVDVNIQENLLRLEGGLCTIQEFLEKLAKSVKYLEARLRRPQYNFDPSDAAQGTAQDTAHDSSSETADQVTDDGSVYYEEDPTTKIYPIEIMINDDQEDLQLQEEEALSMFMSEEEGSQFKEPSCISCFLNKPVYSVSPCGHMKLCSACKDSHRQFGIFDQEGRRLEVCCPQCQTPVIMNQ